MSESNSDLRNRLNAAIPAFRTQVHSVTGTETLAYLVTRDGETIVENVSKRSGESISKGAPHVFNIGSCTKSIVACAVGLLVDQGRLNWDDQVTQHLPEMNLNLRRDPHRQITIRTLLCHQSGAGEYLTAFVSFSGEPRHRLSDPADVEQFLRIAKHILELSHEYYHEDYPYAYSNIGFAIVAVVIGRVSGVPFHRFIERYIFDAIGMRNSFFSNRIPGSVERGYVFDGIDIDANPPQPVEAVDYSNAAIGASLGAWSTCEDMTVFLKEVLKGKSGDPTCKLKQLDQIFPEGSDKRQYFDRSEMEYLKERSYYALGVGIVDGSRSFMRRQSPNSRRSQIIRSTQSSPTDREKEVENDGTRWMFYHSGISRGYNCTFFLHIETRTIVVAMANATGQGYAADWIAEFIVQQIFNLPCIPPMDNIVGAVQIEADLLCSIQSEAIDLVAEAVERASEFSTSHNDHTEFLGKYRNDDWEMSVTMTNDIHGQGSGPFIILNDETDEPRPLRRCGEDVYSSLPTNYGDLLLNFTLDFQHLAQFLFKFERNQNRRVIGLRWCFSVYGEEPNSVEGILNYLPTDEHGIWMKKAS